MCAKKQKNVFAELQKNRRTRGKGFTTPPKLNNTADNIELPEQSEAVPGKVSAARRTYRVSTYISEKAGDHLDQAILDIKRLEGKKPKIAEVFERAIMQLTQKLNN